MRKVIKMYHVQTEDDLALYVRDPKHRVQTWHHVAVFWVQFCLYIVASQGKIMRVCLIEVTEQKRLKYVQCMSMLWDTCMKPFERVATLPIEMRSGDLGYVEIFENLQFTIAYRAGLRSLVLTGNTYSRCHGGPVE
jgi:hypothetical protein